MKLRYIDTNYIVEEIQNYFKEMEIENDKQAQLKFIEDLKNFKGGEMIRNNWAMRDLVSKLFADIAYSLETK